MQVICTTTKDLGPEIWFERVHCPEPQVGDVLTIVEQRSIRGVECYLFAEIHLPYRNIYFDCRNFSPLDGPDEVCILDERIRVMHHDRDRCWEEITPLLDKTNWR